jgi:DNA-binding LacI/PurR family transcriptional regulator/anti-anti-sigma regulatory factor
MTERIRTIGFLAVYTGGSYFGTVLEGVYQVARRRGVRLVAVQLHPEDLHTGQLAREVIDGWVVVLDRRGATQLASTGVPVVSISTSAPGVPDVQPDNYGGMYAMVRHLVDHGHRRIAFVGSEQNADVQVRLKGYQAALADAGLPYDPALVIGTYDELEPAGIQAAKRLLKLGLPCTAIAASTDRNAFGLIQAFQEAGYRVPDDLAVTGFDDMPEAQALNPPLTTIRLRFDALGVTAAELLLDLINGAAAPTTPISVPTALIARRSCGCDTALATFLTSSDATPMGEWRHDLAYAMVTLLQYPLRPTSNLEPRRVWPQVTTLIDTLDAALADHEPPSAADLLRAWQQAMGITADIDVLNAVMDLVERTGYQRLGEVPPAGAHTRVEEALKTIRKEMVRARVATEIARVTYLDSIMRANNSMNTALLRTLTTGVPGLNWMRFTPTHWACLGLWAEQSSESMVEVASIYDRDTHAQIAVGQRYRAAQFPPLGELPKPAHFEESHLILLLPVRTASRDWGILLLSGLLQPQTISVTDPVAVWAEMIGSALDRAALLSEFESQQQQLQLAYDRERALASTVREIGSPVIPLLPGVLLIPLIGAIDAERADQIIRSVLTEVGRQRANTVLIDITAVPLIDTHVANVLIQLTRMTALLGANSLMVGVRPEIAQSIVGLGIDLSGIVTRATLAEAISQLQRRPQLAVTR